MEFQDLLVVKTDVVLTAVTAGRPLDPSLPGPGTFPSCTMRPWRDKVLFPELGHQVRYPGPGSLTLVLDKCVHLSSLSFPFLCRAA